MSESSIGKLTKIYFVTLPLSIAISVMGVMEDARRLLSPCVEVLENPVENIREKTIKTLNNI